MDFAIDCGAPLGLGAVRAGTWSAGQLSAAIPPPAESSPKCDAHHNRVARRPYFRIAVIVEFLLGRVGQQLPNDVAGLQGAIVDLQMFVVVGGREIGRPI